MVLGILSTSKNWERGEKKTVGVHSVPSDGLPGNERKGGALPCSGVGGGKQVVVGTTFPVEGMGREATERTGGWKRSQSHARCKTKGLRTRPRQGRVI